MCMAQSIGTMLGTRIESGARHMLQIRVDKERFVHGLQSKNDGATDAEEELRRNKHRYSMTKDEMVLCTSRNLVDRGVLNNRTHPYPKGITTWYGLCDTHVDKFVDLMRIVDEREYYEQLREIMRSSELNKFGGIPALRCMGYSVGTAYASELNGDTIAAVQIGGLISVQNGAFPFHTGDLVQWYFHEKEEKEFDQKDGKRIAGGGQQPQAPDARERFYLRNTGITQNTKQKMFLPKPYHPENATYGDKLRIFAKCLSAAAPYERVDIMICRQSY
jgi:hypothetical protein